MREKGSGWGGCIVIIWEQSGDSCRLTRELSEDFKIDGKNIEIFL